MLKQRRFWPTIGAIRSLSHHLRSDAVLDRAFVWICRRRWPDADDG